MNPLKKTTLFLISMFTITTTVAGIASAERYRTNVNYDLVIQHSHDLEIVAADLKDCFRDQFRASRLYGKLISTSNKIKRRSHRIHRHGVSRGTCNWHEEIHDLERLVGELNARVDEAVYRANRGYDRPLCGNTTRVVRKLIRKANFHVAGLTKSIHRILDSQRPVYSTPNLHGPIIEQPAPGYVPNSNLGFGVYRSGKTFGDHWTRKSNFYTNRTFPGNSYSNRSEICRTDWYGRSSCDDDVQSRFAVNVGGWKFYLNK